MLGTLYHPAAFGYGMFAGAAFGTYELMERFDERQFEPDKIAKELPIVLQEL